MEKENICPRVSIIMPCYNEEKYISQAIESLIDDWVLENCEMIVVDGESKDKTREIVESIGLRIDQRIASAPEPAKFRPEPFLKLLNNSARIQASGMNRGIEEARGEIIVRADAHCFYPPGYVQRCVELLTNLERDGVANVGGFIRPVGNSLVQRAIALALKNPIGVGDSRWHLGQKSGYVDTVYLGTFRKKVLQEIGLYDPYAHPNEDAELNLRLLKSRRKIYLDGSLGVFYFVRESFKNLAKQYFFYGQGRAYTTWKHRRLTSWRQVAPVAVMAGITSSFVAGFFWPLFWLIPAAYLLALAGGAASSIYFEAKTKKDAEEKVLAKIFTEKKVTEKKARLKSKLFILIMASFAVIHFCWAAGFISKIFKLFFKKSPA